MLDVKSAVRRLITQQLTAGCFTSIIVNPADLSGRKLGPVEQDRRPYHGISLRMRPNRLGCIRILVLIPLFCERCWDIRPSGRAARLRLTSVLAVGCSTGCAVRVCGVSSAAPRKLQPLRLNLYAGFWDFCWPQLFMGLALGLLFVPLTTITMDPLPQEKAKGTMVGSKRAEARIPNPGEGIL